MPNSTDFSESPTDFPENFASDVAADIGKDLFASTVREQPAATGTVSKAPNEAAVAAANVAAQNTPAAAAPAAPTMRALPKSWKKDMEPHWAKLDPAVHDYVYNREADVMRGIQQYQSGYESWNNLVKPFESVLSQHPDVNPIQLMQGLMNSHLALLNPSTPAEAKMQMVQQLLSGYGLSLPSGAAAQPNSPSPELLQLRQQVQQLQQAQQTEAQRRYQAGLADQTKIVEAFASDPKNKYFPEVANDIHRFITSGTATDLASAYELAIWANPAIRAKVLADQQAEAATAATKPRATNGQFRNIDTLDPSKHQRPKETMEQTIERVAREASTRH